MLLPKITNQIYQKTASAFPIPGNYKLHQQKCGVIHGICCLEVPFSFKHDNDGDILAFCNDAKKQGGIPQIVMIDAEAFKDQKNGPVLKIGQEICILKILWGVHNCY